MPCEDVIPSDRTTACLGRMGGALTYVRTYAGVSPNLCGGKGYTYSLRTHCKNIFVYCQTRCTLYKQVQEYTARLYAYIRHTAPNSHLPAFILSDQIAEPKSPLLVLHIYHPSAAVHIYVRSFAPPRVNSELLFTVCCYSYSTYHH